jgi:hypothetical protein
VSSTRRAGRSTRAGRRSELQGGKRTDAMRMGQDEEARRREDVELEQRPPARSPLVPVPRALCCCRRERWRRRWEDVRRRVGDRPAGRREAVDPELGVLDDVAGEEAGHRAPSCDGTSGSRGNGQEEVTEVEDEPSRAVEQGDWCRLPHLTLTSGRVASAARASLGLSTVVLSVKPPAVPNFTAQASQQPSGGCARVPSGPSLPRGRAVDTRRRAGSDEGGRAGTRRARDALPSPTYR